MSGYAYQSSYVRMQRIYICGVEPLDVLSAPNTSARFRLDLI